MKHLALIIIFATSLSAQGLSTIFGGGSNAKKIQGVTVKASLGCTNGQILKYVSANSQFECADDSGGSGAGDVEGATNLTTAGRMVGVSAANTVTEYSDFIRTAAGRYQIYDATATTGVTTLTVRAGAGQSSTNTAEWRSSSNVLQHYWAGTDYKFGTGGTISDVNNKVAIYSTLGFRLANDRTFAFSSDANQYGTVDLGLSRSSANNLGVTNGSSTTYWTLGAGGITCGSGDGNSAACDVGTTGARVRNVNAVGAGTFLGNVVAANMNLAASGIYFWSNRSNITSSADGNVTLWNNAFSGFDRLQFGGTTSSFPALKRSSTTLAARLADDSADAPISASNVTASSDFIGSSTSCIYLGASGDDGSWRFCRSGSNLVFERRESSSWVSKGQFTN